MNFKGYKRADGSIGIRNKTLIIAVDECCDGIARGISDKVKDSVVLTNWYTCMLGGNEETFNQMIAVGKNPNIGGVLVISMGCGSILPEQIAKPIADTGKMVDTLICQKNGGTRKSIEIGAEKLQAIRNEIDKAPRVEVPISELIVGVKCGGSDTSSGMASNPSVGNAVDKLIDMGGIAIGGELFELQGCQQNLKRRAVSEEVFNKIDSLIEAERIRWSVEGTNVETMSIGNSVGGLTTIEEKSFGALYKMGSKPIEDILEINKDFIEKPKKSGFYLSETTMLCGGAGVNFASLGAQVILWTSGAAGFNNSIVPVIRVSGNEDLFNDDMDIDARGIMNGTDTVDNVGNEILKNIVEVANGKKTQLEDIGSATLTLYQKDQRLESLLFKKCGK